MKISDIEELAILEKKASILLNKSIEPSFYNYFFQKPIEWLIENKGKIEKDFADNLQKIKFHVIMSSNLCERNALILELQDSNIEEFADYINFVPFNILKECEKKRIQKIFEKFKGIKNEYLKICYFDKERRK